MQELLKEYQSTADMLLIHIKTCNSDKHKSSCCKIKKLALLNQMYEDVAYAIGQIYLCINHEKGKG